MVDTNLLVAALQAHGYAVGKVIPVAADAGDFEFEVDGEILTLDEARALVEADETDSAPPLV